jgi:hypothetical protein
VGVGVHVAPGDIELYDDGELSEVGMGHW